MKKTTKKEPKKQTKKEPKKTNFSLAECARKLAVEYPHLALTANQLRRMARNGIIGALDLPACGVIRRGYHVVNYNDLVKFLKKCYKPAIHI